MATHTLLPSVETCHYGFFDATLKPALSVKSGDTVTIDTVTGSRDVIPDRTRFHVPEVLDEILDKLPPFGPHILTGPVYVEGARPGNVLEVRIHDVRVIQDWGFNIIVPLLGTLPHDYDEMRRVNIPLDLERQVGIMPWGLELPLRPFFGVMGVAPPKGWGRISSIAPVTWSSNAAMRSATGTGGSGGVDSALRASRWCSSRCAPRA